MRARGRPANTPIVPRSVWTTSHASIADTTGRAAWLSLLKLRNRVAITAITRAALAGGRKWSNPRTRKIVALGVTLVTLANGNRRKSKWGHLVMGYTRGTLAATLEDPARGEESRPAITTLAGRHRADGDLVNGQVGYLRALELSGLLYRQCLPADEAEAYEIYTNRDGQLFTSNRYWIVGHSAYATPEAIAEALEAIEESYTLEGPPPRAPPR